MATTSILVHTQGVCGHAHPGRELLDGRMAHHVELHAPEGTCRHCGARWHPLLLAGRFERPASPSPSALAPARDPPGASPAPPSALATPELLAIALAHPVMTRSRQRDLPPFLLDFAPAPHRARPSLRPEAGLLGVGLTGNEGGGVGTYR